MAYKDTVFFYQPTDLKHSCLKVFNKTGDELSLAGDDSCGALRHHARTSLCIFPEGGHEQQGEVVTHVTPAALLHKLAAHLGYTLRRKR